MHKTCVVVLPLGTHVILLEKDHHLAQEVLEKIQGKYVCH